MNVYRQRLDHWMVHRVGLARPWQGRMLGGVCAGLALRWGVELMMVRFAFLILALASGLGAVVYALLWVLVPTPDGAPRARELAQLRERLGPLWSRSRASLRGARSKRSQPGTWPSALSHGHLASGLIAGGVFILLVSFGTFAWLTWPRALGLAAVIVGVGLLLGASSDRHPR